MFLFETFMKTHCHCFAVKTIIRNCLIFFSLETCLYYSYFWEKVNLLIQKICKNYLSESKKNFKISCFYVRNIHENTLSLFRSENNHKKLSNIFFFRDISLIFLLLGEGEPVDTKNAKTIRLGQKRTSKLAFFVQNIQENTLSFFRVETTWLLEIVGYARYGMMHCIYYIKMW